MLLLCSALTPALSAAPSEWTDRQGTRIKGEPTEILGSFALFRTGSRSGQRVLLRGFSVAECQRLHRELAGKPPRADRWSDARGAATAKLPGRGFRVADKKLVPVDFTALPEPEILLVLAGSPNNGESWRMLENMRALHARLQRVYAGRIATVFIGSVQSEADYRRFTVDTWMPWIVADYHGREALGPISRFIPGEGALMVAMSREGTPLLSAVATDLGAIKQFTDDLIDLLWAINPQNPQSWLDRAHYFNATRPLEFAQGTTGPLPLGNPLRVEGLRRWGVQRIAARLEVGANGRVTAVALQPDTIAPAERAAKLADALQRHTYFLPALDHGQPVAGTYDYALDVPPEDPALAADAAWLGGVARVDLPISSWLVLRPIHVPEADFGGIDHVDASGKVVLKSLEIAGDGASRQAQLSAFHTNWFDEAGAASVRPVEGQTQPVDQERPVWRTLVPQDGLVDFATGMANCDFCVGYAWTEFDSPADVDAWLAIGSDDGLKIWHNGTLVTDRWIRRPSRLDDDIVPLRLTKGKNQLLIKIQNMKIDWSFIYRLRMRDRSA